MTIVQQLRGLTQGELSRLAASNTAFQSGQLAGSPDELEDTGQLPRGLAERYYADRVDYTFTSYGTPIAWRARGCWVLPQLPHGMINSRHLELVTAAVLAS